jgi:predicted alpha/beta-hydrolase family hydrolase
VSGLLLTPPRPHACYIFAHGAGAGMTHPFMTAVAAGLGDRGIATLRYQFPYMEQRARRPDPPGLAQATVRKSFGGRMTSQAQAASALPGVRGLAFLGFPLHPAGRPSDERAAHLHDVRLPMLFLQGTRDALADLGLLRPLAQRLGAHATLELLQDADHSFRVPARTGRKDADVRREMLDRLAAWTLAVIEAR